MGILENILPQGWAIYREALCASGYIAQPLWSIVSNIPMPRPLYYHNIQEPDLNSNQGISLLKSCIPCCCKPIQVENISRYVLILISNTYREKATQIWKKYISICFDVTQQFQVKLGYFFYDFKYKTYKTLQENSIFILKRCVLEYKNIQYANIYFSRGWNPQAHTVKYPLPNL